MMLLRRRQERTPRERGFVLVWMALCLVVLLGMTAMAIDLGHALYEQQQLQNAADAAALSGVVKLPADAPGAIALSNGVGMQNSPDPAPQATITSCAQDAVSCPSLHTNQLQVHMTDKVDTWFAKVFGLDSVTVHADGTAEYDPPVALGSPRSNFGGGPNLQAGACSGCYDSQIWAEISSQYNSKVDGDAINMGNCAVSADNCSSTGFNNSDRDPNGELFQIDNRGGGPLNIFVYDPAFIDTEQYCQEKASYGESGAFPAGVWGSAWEGAHPNDKANAGGSALTASASCAGDDIVGGARIYGYSGSSPAFTTLPASNTVYSLYKLDDPLSPLSGQWLCSFTYKGYWGPANLPRTSSPTVEEQSFHRWDNVTARAGSCGTLTGPQYVLQVQTGSGVAKVGGGITSTDGSAGSNNFAIDACQVCASPAADSGVSVSAITKMALHTNAAAGNGSPEFYVARVPQWAAGNTLNLSFYDIGDADIGTGTLKFSITSADAKNNGTPIGEMSNCTHSDPTTRGYTVGQPAPWANNAQQTDWGALNTANCDVTLTNATKTGWNGKWVTFDIPIPAGYTCNEADFTQCWLKLNFSLTDGAQGFHDTTTWFAKLSGSPVRLIK